MFGDATWLDDRTTAQRRRFDAFERDHGAGPLVVVEVGAGTAIPTIRFASERLGSRPGNLVVRINPREPRIDPPHVSIAAGALDGLARIGRALGPDR
jgi:hypothetical protein